jgi:two-component system KDP operon response regulator KdpE
MKVLLIEDDLATVEAIRLCFEIYWHEATLVATAEGFNGIDLLKRERPDVIILDLGLPDIDGLRVLEEIRQFTDVPVLIISARDTQEAIVKGLELGAEDYIVKPFSYRELQSRLEGILRPSLPEGKISSGGLDIDLATGQVAVDGNPVELAPIEWALLSHLVKNEGRTVPLQRLAKEVWKSDSIDRMAMRTTASKLSKQLGDDPRAPRIILSEHEVGYRFVRPV